MTKNIFEENFFVESEFLPAKPTVNSIKIYHPFASLANEYFANKGFDITPLESGSIKISFENLTKKEKVELLEEMKYFLKSSKQKVIKDFLIYK